MGECRRTPRGAQLEEGMGNDAEEEEEIGDAPPTAGGAYRDLLPDEAEAKPLVLE